MRDAGKVIMATKPYYTLINTSIGKDPAVVVVNSALRTFEDRDAFPWHLTLSIDCKLLGDNGMPTTQEVKILQRLEDGISSALQVEENTLFLARITCRGTRDLLYRVHDPEVTNKALQQLISSESQLREWDYHIEQDSGWELAQPELRLLEHDPRFN